MQGKFTVLGPRQNLFIGNNFQITRSPWPFFDVKGGGITFGDNVTVSSGVYILTHNHQFDKKNWRDLEEVITEDPTEIGDYVFIGINAIIMPSCKSIGEHSVIGAGAVVTKNVPACEIWAGNPARKIGNVT